MLGKAHSGKKKNCMCCHHTFVPLFIYRNIMATESCKLSLQSFLFPQASWMEVFGLDGEGRRQSPWELPLRRRSYWNASANNVWDQDSGEGARDAADA